MQEALDHAVRPLLLFHLKGPQMSSLAGGLAENIVSQLCFTLQPCSWLLDRDARDT